MTDLCRRSPKRELKGSRELNLRLRRTERLGVSRIVGYTVQIQDSCQIQGKSPVCARSRASSQQQRRVFGCPINLRHAASLQQAQVDDILLSRLVRLFVANSLAQIGRVLDRHLGGLADVAVDVHHVDLVRSFRVWPQTTAGPCSPARRASRRQRATTQEWPLLRAGRPSERP